MRGLLSSTDDHGDDHGGHSGFALPHLVVVLFLLFTGALVRSVLLSMPKSIFHPPFTVIMGVLGFTFAGETACPLKL